MTYVIKAHFILVEPVPEEVKICRHDRVQNKIAMQWFEGQ